MLRLRGLHKSYPVGDRALHVLRGIDLDVDAGEMVSIMGASGSGKSTLLNIIGLLDHHDSGEYALDGRVIERLSERRAAVLRGRNLGFVFQSFNLIPFKTAVENVALPLYYRGVGRRKRNREAAEVLERVGLGDRSEQRPTEMSGGEQQRVAIARALIGKPRVLLADEPTGALDSGTSRDVLHTLREVNGEGITVVVVTHAPEIAALTDRVISINDGLIVDGPVPAAAHA